LVVLFVAAAAHAQIPTSGAMLTIQDPNNVVLLNIYDSQIPGVLGTVPLSPCTAVDAKIKTAAYVLQGGSATGCHPPDLYEITDVATGIESFQPRSDNAVHQQRGEKLINNFDIETHFICVGKCAQNVTSGNNKTFCNTSGTICIKVLNGSPADDGFVKVTNDTGSAFSGTITLQGAPNSAGCAPASDSVQFTPPNTLANGGFVILAIGQPGTQATPTINPDSSTCGGFNYDQKQPLAVLNNLNQTVQLEANFSFGHDDFIVKCSDCIAGDVATFRPVPWPQSMFSVAADSPFGVGQKCISYADFSSSNPEAPYGVCPEHQTHCVNHGVTCLDAETLSWQGRLDFIIDQNTIPNVISGVHFLGEPAVDCPQNFFEKDIALSYTGVQSGMDAPPLLVGSGGTKTLNCFVPTYNPFAAPIVAGQQVFAVNGFFSPDQPPPTINPENGGQNIGLPFFYADGAGGPGVTTLKWCEPGPAPDGTCADGTTPVPFVSLLRTPFTCPGFPPGTTNSTDGFIGPATNSFMQNLGAGSYKINFASSNTEPTSNNCFWLGLVFSSGQSNPFMNEFQFTK
jgi:hypothetical protein